MSDENPNKDTAAEVALPGGFKASLKGYHLGNLLQILMVGVLTTIGMLQWDMREQQKIANEKFAKSMEVEHDKIRAAIEKNAEAQEEMNFILTLSVDDRERLGLGMPESLRRKVGRSTIGANPYGRTR